MGLETGTYIDDLVRTNPLGTDDRSTADDHMRLIKDLILNTFPNIDNACNMTPTELNKLVGMTVTASELNRLGGLTANLSFLNGSTALASSDNVLDNFPAGTLMTFQQTAAPTGWTKGVTHNNKAFRVVTGTAGSAGTSNFTTVFGLQATNNHTLTVAQTPAHTHGSSGAHDHNYLASTTNPSSSSSSPSNTGNQVVATTGSGNHTHTSVGSGNGHSHNIELRVQYVDLIIADKD